MNLQEIKISTLMKLKGLYYWKLQTIDEWISYDFGIYKDDYLIGKKKAIKYSKWCF